MHSLSKYNMETDPNGSPLVTIVFDPKFRMFGIFNFKMPIIGIFDGISGTFSWSTPQRGEIITLDERTKVAKCVYSDRDVMKLYENGFDKVDYSCAFSTYRKIMAKATASFKNKILPFREHLYPYAKLSSAFYENPAFNMTKYFLGQEAFLDELKPFRKFTNHMRTIVANGDITADMKTVGLNSGLLNNQTPLSKAIIKFLIAVYAKQDGKFGTALLQRLSDAVTRDSDKKETLVEDIVGKM